MVGPPRIWSGCTLVAVIPAESTTATRRHTTLALRAIGLALIALLCLAPSGLAADDLFYSNHNYSWPTPASGTVKRIPQAGPTSSNVLSISNATFAGVAVNGTHVYTAVRDDIMAPGGADAIARATLDGSDPQATYLTPCGGGVFRTGSLAITATHVYYLCMTGPNVTSVGRADITGATPSPDNSWMPAPNASMMDIAVNATHLYYSVSGVSGKIGRIALDPSASAQEVAVANVTDLALSPTHVYWSVDSTLRGGLSAPVVERMALDLSGSISTFAVQGTGNTSPTAIAVSDDYVFWVTTGGGSSDQGIRRAPISDGAASSFLVSPSGTIEDIAVRLPTGSSASSTHDLTVAKAGTGAGTVASTPAGIDCGATCKGSFASGTSVTLTATAAAGSTFAGWSGACTGASATCAVTVSEAATATATFTATSATVKGKPAVKQGRATLTVDVPAAGTIKMVGTRRSGRATRAKTAPVCTATRTVTKAGSVKISCVPNAATRKLLRKSKIRVTVTLTFTSEAGTTATTQTTLTLPRRR